MPSVSKNIKNITNITNIANIDFDSLINNSNNLRKVTLSDILGNTSNNVVNDKYLPSQNKVKNNRLQGEYGEKKFIKP